MLHLVHKSCGGNLVYKVIIEGSYSNCNCDIQHKTAIISITPGSLFFQDINVILKGLYCKTCGVVPTSKTILIQCPQCGTSSAIDRLVYFTLNDGGIIGCENCRDMITHRIKVSMHDPAYIPEEKKVKLNIDFKEDNNE